MILPLVLSLLTTPQTDRPLPPPPQVAVIGRFETEGGAYKVTNYTQILLDGERIPALKEGLTVTRIEVDGKYVTKIHLTNAAGEK